MARCSQHANSLLPSLSSQAVVVAEEDKAEEARVVVAKGEADKASKVALPSTPTDW